MADIEPPEELLEAMRVHGRRDGRYGLEAPPFASRALEAAYREGYAEGEKAREGED